jgi:hypothetical protein
MLVKRLVWRDPAAVHRGLLPKVTLGLRARGSAFDRLAQQPCYSVGFTTPASQRQPRVLSTPGAIKSRSSPLARGHLTHPLTEGEVLSPPGMRSARAALTGAKPHTFPWD